MKNQLIQFKSGSLPPIPVTPPLDLPSEEVPAPSRQSGLLVGERVERSVLKIVELVLYG